MRVDIEAEALDPFLALLERYRPCPECGSARVTVQRLGSSDTDSLRARCADCGMSRVASAADGLGHLPSHGDS
jgi:ferredoxin-like protein FixX